MLPVSAADGRLAPLRTHLTERAGAAMASVSTEGCILLAGLFFTLFSNYRFWTAWAAGRDWSVSSTWLLAATTGVLLTAVHCFILGLVVFRRTAKPLLALLFVVTALAAFYMDRFTVFFNLSMVRNVLHTDVREARELLSSAMLWHLLMYGLLPAALVWQIQIPRRSAVRSLVVRLLFMLSLLLAAGLALALTFKDFSSLMRNHKEMRFLITPANYIVSTVRLAMLETEEAGAARIPVGADASGRGASDKAKPRLLLLVVGETARAANWGLNGYARQTTPRLASLDVINFPQVVSCGTNTEVSVPCMFSPFGRKNYDEKKIRRHESVLHVMEHAGVKTIWRDNQSGCKGVCNGLEMQQANDLREPELCKGEHCLDLVLLKNLEAQLQRHPRDLVVVLHQLGNHGPAYYRRHPDAFRQFLPTCDDADLGKCSREQIVNSYDNALLYTDYFLAEAIDRLQSQQSHDAALIYLSDHGESLGENGIFLHGLPYAIAPWEQKEVPMVMWMSRGFRASTGLDAACLGRRAQEPASHDNLFHSLLGLMSIKTAVYDPAYDLTAKCRKDWSAL